MACDESGGSSSDPFGWDLIVSIRRRFVEHSSGWLGVVRSAGRRWEPPLVGWVKFNTDIAIR